MKFNTSVAKGLKLKFRKLWWIIPKFVEVTGEKLAGREPFAPHDIDYYFIQYTLVSTQI